MRQAGPLPTLLAAVLTTVALFALTGYQVTSETGGTRLLSRFAAALIEVDRWLPVHIEDIELLARDRLDGFVRPAGLPVAVILPGHRIVGADEGEVRHLLVKAMGRALYDEGNDAFVDETGRSNPPGLKEPSRWTVMLLSRGSHGFWRALLALSVLGLLGASMLARNNGRPLLRQIVMGAGLSTGAAVTATVVASVAGGAVDSPVNDTIASILRDGAWLGLRNSLAVAAVAAGLLLLTRMLNRDEATGRQVQPTEPPA